MKTLTTLVALLLIGASVYATDGDKKNAKKKVAVVQNEQAKFKLVYLEDAPGEVTIKLRNKRGDIIHQQTVTNEGGFSQPYDFNSLPKGEYKFEVIKADGSIVSHEIVYKAWEIQPDFQANILNVNDKKTFRLAVTNSGRVNVKIYNEDHKLIHEENTNQKDGFRRNYDLSKINGENFTFVVSNETGSISMDAN